MSEKRFSWIAEKIGQHYQISIRDGDKEYTISDDFFKSKDVVAVIVDLLNELSEENEQLHQKNTKLIAKIDFLERVIDGDINE